MNRSTLGLSASRSKSARATTRSSPLSLPYFGRERRGKSIQEWKSGRGRLRSFFHSSTLPLLALRCFLRGVLLRSLVELLLASLRAEIVGLPAPFTRQSRSRRLDIHPTNR